MVKYLAIFFAILGSSFAGLSDYFPWKQSSPSLTNLLALQNARKQINTQRKQAVDAVNTDDLQELRRKIRTEDDQIEEIKRRFEHRLDDIRRDFMGLRNDLQDRIDKRTQDYKDALVRIKRQKAIISFVSSWSKRYGILVKNLLDLKNKLLEDYNEDLIKRYDVTLKAIISANDDLIANWKDQVTDKEIQTLMHRMKEHLLTRDKLIKQLQQKLRTRSFTLSNDPLADLKIAVKQAKCSFIKDVGKLNDDTMRSCFVDAFRAKPPRQDEHCQSIITPGARSKKQVIDPSRPLSDYIACAQSVTLGKPQETIGKQTTKRTPAEILLDLDANRQLIDALSTKERLGMTEVSGKQLDRKRLEDQFAKAYADYQTDLDPLRQNLRSLDKQLTAIIDLARAHLNSILDQTYVLEQDNTELTDALMEEGGADKIQDIVVAMVQNSLSDKAKEFALYLLNKIPGSTFVLQIDQKQIQSTLRLIIDIATRDQILARQFMDSQILSPAMEQALKQLEKKYPDFKVDQAILRVQDKLGIVAKVCNVGKGLLGAVAKGAKAAAQFCFGEQSPTTPLNSTMLDHKKHLDQGILKEGEAKTSLQALSHRADVALSGAKEDMMALRCPYITGLDTLSKPNIDKCAAWFLQTVKPETKEQFPSCSPWIASSSLDCVKDTQTGRPISPAVQLSVLVSHLQTGIIARKALGNADAIVKSSNTVINAIDRTKKELDGAIAQLTTFQSSWIEKRRAQIANLKVRQGEAQQQYKDLNGKLMQIQKNWAQYLWNLANLKDLYSGFLALFTAQVVGSTTPPEDKNLYQDVQKLKKLVENLGRGINDLEGRMNGFDSDIRYQKESRAFRKPVDTLLANLLSLQKQLDEASHQGNTITKKVDTAVKLLNCKWFRGISAGQRGLDQCLSAIIDRVRQLGTKTNKPQCTTIDLKSPYIEVDLNKCSAHSARSTSVNEGDLVKAGRIIQGMKLDDTDAMINKLMLEGGYSHEQATKILEDMLIL